MQLPKLPNFEGGSNEEKLKDAKASQEAAIVAQAAIDMERTLMPPPPPGIKKVKKSESYVPITQVKSIPGYLADRLQEALWREGLHIINEGYATTKDLDRAIEDGPGLRWSLMGTFLTFHLAGGKAGMKHMLKQFGPALKLPWTKLKAPKLSKKLSSRVIAGTKQQAKGKSVAMISNIRDKYLVELQKLRKKYEKQIRN